MEATGTGRANVDRAATLSRDQVEQMIAARAVAKKAKNYAEADRIRQELFSLPASCSRIRRRARPWRRAWSFFLPR